MRSGPIELQPAREFMQRMQELEAELQRARQAAHRQRISPNATARWGLEPKPTPQHEEGWFLTYLDMMTLLLVVMIVMLAFSGSLVGGHAADAFGRTTTPAPASAPPSASIGNSPKEALTAQPDPPLNPAGATTSEPLLQGAATLASIPAPDTALPYPAAPATAFEQSAYPDHATTLIASAYPTPADLAPPPRPEPPALPITGAGSPDTPAPMAGMAPIQANPASPLANDRAKQESSPTATVNATGPTDTQQPTQTLATHPQADATPPPETAAPTASTPDAGSPTLASSPHAKPLSAPASPSEGQALAAALPLDELGSEVEVIVNQRSVSLRINSEILFGTGQADLSVHGSDVLKRMAEVLAKGGYDIVVEGHTDSVPVRANGRYPSNWELSSARAGSVVRYLLANGVDKAHLKAVGYADTRPIASNKEATGRAKNRRVELVIEKPAAED